MHLKKVVIQNFRSVSKQVIVPLDSRVTILLGSNDHGKSNLLAAVRLLNADTKATPDDLNWTLADDETAKQQYEIRFELGITDEEKAEIEKIINIVTTTPGASPQGVEDDFLLFRSGSITLLRTLDERRVVGLNAAHELGGKIAAFIEKRLPRVELFSPEATSLPDSVTHDQIATEPFEFMQGIFFLAGLDFKKSALFEQTDTNVKRLEEASRRLNEEIQKQWSQGRDLELRFQLAHRQGRIELLVDDPAVKTRKVRLSKRSTGVTQFFRMKMVLFARQKKVGQAKSYIYLFDEPGTHLHPKGQRDLVQVFEALADNFQIMYATHSVFLLNHNHPERHRLIFKDDGGTRVENKGAKANWRDAISALGLTLPPTVLFCDKVLLVEGDSDVLYLYELIRQMNAIGEISIDANHLGICPFGDEQELKFSIRRFSEAHAEHIRLGLMTDGDKAGAKYQEVAKKMGDIKSVPPLPLPMEMSIEDFCLFPDLWIAAVKQLAEEAGYEGATLEAFHQALQTPPERNRGAWIKQAWRTAFKGDLSKTSAARLYVERVRGEAKDEGADAALIAQAKELMIKLRDALRLPAEKAEVGI